MNRLATETSPYLLQHADNPVDWYPWGEEALALAKEQDKPILLSIGYAACHWCHVMAHESFEDDETAKLMNQYYVNIKVDREERPDLDHIYMSAVQAMTGQGGWPMTMFLTPDGHPIYGGTYFPPTPRYGMPSFRNILLGVADAWGTKREGLLENSQKLVAHIARDYALTSTDDLPANLIPTAISQATTSFDKTEGGFGSAPKFPPSMLIEALLRVATVETQNLASLPTSLQMAEHTLQKMAHGGMYDQIGGGFARYSVDNEWLVPHFEKMLYDNGQLARVYLHVYQLTRSPFYRRITEETLDWTLKEMTHADGGFYSSLDADSEGEEGKFYVWQKAEIVEILQEAAPLFMAYYDVTDNGNWEHKNILRALKPLAEVAQQFGLSETDAVVSIEESKSALYAVRAKRIWPGLDDKILTSWNGLMLGAMAEAGAILGRSDYLLAACKNAEFLYDNLRTPEGRLLRTWKAGSKAKYNAYLEDYAYLADGLLALYQATYHERWFVWAQELAEMMLAHFHDAQAGGFYDTSDDHETLIHRPKTLEDNAVPSPNAMAARVLLTLGLLTGEGKYTDIAQSMVAALAPAMMQYPTGFGHWLGNAWLLQNSPKEVAIISDDVETASALIAVLRDRFRPNLVSAVGDKTSTIPLLQNRLRMNGQPTAYVCENFACQVPTTDPVKLNKQLVSE